MIGRYGVNVLKMFVSWRFLIISVCLVPLELDAVTKYWVPVQRILYHKVFSIVDFVGCVTCSLYHTTPPFVLKEWRPTDDAPATDGKIHTELG